MKLEYSNHAYCASLPLSHSLEVYICVMTLTGHWFFQLSDLRYIVFFENISLI